MRIPTNDLSLLDLECFMSEWLTSAPFAPFEAKLSVSNAEQVNETAAI